MGMHTSRCDMIWARVKAAKSAWLRVIKIRPTPRRSEGETPSSGCFYGEPYRPKTCKLAPPVLMVESPTSDRSPHSGPGHGRHNDIE